MSEEANNLRTLDFFGEFTPAEWGRVAGEMVVRVSTEGMVKRLGLLGCRGNNTESCKYFEKDE